ncbi:MAG: Gfo/Idh/MocA family oxidoreductase, partial [Pirellulaceae bacterium]|nr:Gfo/Idh/MocA family oxidoreductase [Pirellulaceae bacterium]
MSDKDRREFLKSAAAGTGFALAATAAIAETQRSANEPIRVGLLGMGGRMRSHITALAQMAEDNVEIVAICDCDQSKLDSAVERYPELKGKKLALYSDMRKMFDDKSIDAVSNALGDRWHALSTIWACQA